MSVETWVRGPIGLDAERRVTRTGCRTVLVMMPTMTAGARLLDLTALVENDHRVQVIFTVPESTETRHGAVAFARARGRLVIPWHQAVQHRFDLVLAASYDGLQQVRGPVLVVPHGASSLMSRKFCRGSASTLPHSGLSRETLIHRGRVIPSVLALTHDSELTVLRRTCPEALPAAVVAGDICYDRMVASLPMRARYRRALGVGNRQGLLMVSSTWSTESVFGRHADLCERLLTELRGEGHRVALVLHPEIWSVHGAWQVRAWLARCIREGLLLIPPEEGWRATAVASDWVLGDHGSTTQYAAAIGRPVVLGAFPVHAIRSGSLADAVAHRSPVLDPEVPVLSQFGSAAERDAGPDNAIAGLVTSRPTRSAAILRHAIYQQLGLAEPVLPAETWPVPLPRVVGNRRDPDEEIL